MQVPFYTTDVFTNKTFGGAQVAVVTEANKLSDIQMQKIASELNLWSTVFVDDGLVENAFSMRMFTPEREIEFAGHATVAATQVMSTIGKVNFNGVNTPIIFQHKTDDLEVHITQQANEELLTTFSIDTAPIIDNYVPSNEELAELLSIDSKMIGIKNFRPLLVSNKGIYIVVPIYYLEQLQAARFNLQAWNRSLAPNTLADEILLFSPQTDNSSADFHLRLLSPTLEPTNEPPVGSAIPAFSAYLCAHEHIQKGTYSFIAERGSANKRQSLLHVEVDNKSSERLTVRIGGTAVVVCEGKITL